MKKNKNIKRGFVIAFASLLALLPLGLSVPKVESSAEAFGEDGVFYSDGLYNSNAYVNPLSYFTFSFRRPNDDWSGELDNTRIDTYSFSLPHTYHNSEFLYERGVNSLNTVWNYLPLFSGSVRYQYQYNSALSKNGYFTFSNFPIITADLPTPTGINVYDNVPTYQMSCFNTLIPLSCFQDLFSGRFNLFGPANVYDLQCTFTQLKYDEDGKPYMDDYSIPSSFNSIPISPENNGFFFDSFMSSYGLSASRLEDFVFLSGLDLIFVKSFVLTFYLDSLPFETSPHRDVAETFYYIPQVTYHAYTNIVPVTVSAENSLLNSYYSIFTTFEYTPVSALDNIYAIVDGFFGLEIFPGFYISYILYIGVAGLIIGFAIKIFLQG